MGCAGHSVVQTPTLDSLARSGTRFTNAYSESPVCVPARRTIMTGTTPRTHGDRVMGSSPMPDLTTVAQTFRNAGYQAFGVGKLHVTPTRDRIGFDDVINFEEGRVNQGALDDYEIWLGDQGFAGEQFMHGMGSNQYVSRPWHLPEYAHPTNWLTGQMARTIKRRDPRKPGFWYLGYNHPHPPLAPLQEYLDLYRDVEIDEPFCGEWVGEGENTLGAVSEAKYFNAAQIRQARRAFYALCTHIDHQLRLVIGTLREEGLLNNTIICFSSDHGDMLGNHGLWRKGLFYENSANVPMLLIAPQGDESVAMNATDDRLIGWQDVMPTLCDLAGVPIPETVDGISMVGEQRREYLYGEVYEDAKATRMMRDERYKLIYCPPGNRLQLFDLQNDPQELRDLSEGAEYSETRERLTQKLIVEFYGSDKQYVRDGVLIGVEKMPASADDRGLSGQRGPHWPPLRTSST